MVLSSSENLVCSLAMHLSAPRHPVVGLLGTVLLLTMFGCANTDPPPPESHTPPQPSDQVAVESLPRNPLRTCPTAVLFDRSTGLFSVEWNDCDGEPADWVPIWTVDGNTRVEGLLLPEAGTPEFSRIVRGGPNEVSGMYGLELASQVRPKGEGWEIALKRWAVDGGTVDTAKTRPVAGRVRVRVHPSSIGPPILPGIAVPRHPETGATR